MPTMQMRPCLDCRVRQLRAAARSVASGFSTSTSAPCSNAMSASGTWLLLAVQMLTASSRSESNMSVGFAYQRAARILPPPFRRVFDPHRPPRPTPPLDDFDSAASAQRGNRSRSDDANSYSHAWSLLKIPIHRDIAFRISSTKSRVMSCGRVIAEPTTTAQHPSSIQASPPLGAGYGPPRPPRP